MILLHITCYVLKSYLFSIWRLYSYEVLGRVSKLVTHQACFAQRETHHQLEIQMLTFTKQLSCTEVILDITRVQNKDGKRFFEGKEKSLKSFSFYCVCVFVCIWKIVLKKIMITIMVVMVMTLHANFIKT